MNKQSHAALQTQIVDLGDAKELTQGFPDPTQYEEDLQVIGNETP